MSSAPRPHGQVPEPGSRKSILSSLPSRNVDPKRLTRRRGGAENFAENHFRSLLAFLRPSPETPLPLRPFLTLGFLRVSSASPGPEGTPRVEWAPPLVQSPETPLPLRPFLTLGFLRVSSASPGREGTPRVEWAPPLVQSPETPLPLRPFLILGFLRVSSASPGPEGTPRVESAPPLVQSPETSPPLRPFLTLGFLRVSSASPGQRAPPASNGPRRWSRVQKLRSLCDAPFPWFFSAFAPRLRRRASPRRMGPAAGPEGTHTSGFPRHSRRRATRRRNRSTA